jgi:hypothetical protein
MFEMEFVQEIQDLRLQDDDYDIDDRHLIVYIHHPRNFMDFFHRHLFEDTRLIRSIIFERTRLDFPTLVEILQYFNDLVFIEFFEVDFDMTSWRNQHDQEIVFGPSSRPRFVNFRGSRFLEDFESSRFLGPEETTVSQDGTVSSSRPMRTEIVANRIPILFYELAASRRGLVLFERTG